MTIDLEGNHNTVLAQRSWHTKPAEAGNIKLRIKRIKRIFWPPYGLKITMLRIKIIKVKMVALRAKKILTQSWLTPEI